MIYGNKINCENKKKKWTKLEGKKHIKMTYNFIFFVKEKILLQVKIMLSTRYN